MTIEATVPEPMRILVAGDDADLLSLCREALDSAGPAVGRSTPFEFQSCCSGSEAMDRVRAALEDQRPFALAFLDLHLNSGSGRSAIGRQIRQIDPDINFVVVTDTMDAGVGNIAERIQPADKLLFVQKPLHVQEIRQFAEAMGAKWRVERLLRKANAELKDRLKDLEGSRRALLVNKGELEDVNNQLLETNNALSVLARNLERTRKESEKQVLRKTRTLIIPAIDKLRQDRRLARYRTDFDLLAGYVENLTSDISDKTRNAEMLSTTESRIASMIRLGLSSEDIADHLSVSVSTVKTHRKNIRRKLKLKNTGKNLRSYLESKLSSD